MQLDKDFSSSNSQLISLQAEKQKLSMSLDNATVARNSACSQLQTSAVEAQGVADVQLQQMEKMVDKMQKECQSE